MLRCLNAVREQSNRPDNIVIVNNASTDGTESAIATAFNISDALNQEEVLLPVSDDGTTHVYLYNKNKNSGGSGGFNKGMEICFDSFKSDFYWMMDDDGYPTPTCLEQLIGTAIKNHYDYVMPVSIDIDNHDQLSWAVRKRNGEKTIMFDELKKSWGDILEYVTPFNGILLSADCVGKVGYINKDFFIWGDEYEHYWRCVKAGYKPVTDLHSIFYHPAAKLPLVPICFGLTKVPFADSPIRMICLARNYTYIYLHYNQKYKIPLKFMMYTWLFLITRHLDFKYWILYCKSVKDGFTGNFSRHLNYLKQK